MIFKTTVSGADFGESRMVANAKTGAGRPIWCEGPNTELGSITISIAIVHYSGCRCDMDRAFIYGNWVSVRSSRIYLTKSGRMWQHDGKYYPQCKRQGQ